MRGLIFLLCLALVPLSARAAAFLAQAGHFTLDYGIYAGGFKSLDMTTEYEVGPQTYGLTVTARPYGVIGKLLPWAGTFTTRGHVADGKAIPDSHVKQSRWAEDSDDDRFTYENGVLTHLVRTDTKHGADRREDAMPPLAFHQNSVDLLTATMRMLDDASRNGGRACDSSSDVYDGKRRFRLEFHGKGTENLQASDYNIYAGPAQMCEIELVPLENFNGKKRGYYKIQEDARANGQLPRVWLAPLWEGGPLLPVRMLVKSEYGAVLAHVQHFTH